MREEKFPHTRKPLHWWRRGWGGELWSHRGERSNRGAEGKAERFLHRGSVLTSTHQPETLVCSPARAGGGWELRLRLQRSDPQGEDWGWLCEDSLKWVSVPQLAGRESRKESGPAGEARDHCFGVHEERGFLLCEPADSKALPKQAPEMGMSHSYHVGCQRRTQTATSAATAIKSPVCKHRSLPTHSQEPMQHATARLL